MGNHRHVGTFAGSQHQSFALHRRFDQPAVAADAGQRMAWERQLKEARPAAFTSRHRLSNSGSRGEARVNATIDQNRLPLRSEETDQGVPSRWLSEPAVAVEGDVAEHQDDLVSERLWLGRKF